MELEALSDEPPPKLTIRLILWEEGPSDAVEIQPGAGPSAEDLIPSEAFPGLATEDQGERFSGVEAQEHESREVSVAETYNPLGNGEVGTQSSSDLRSLSDETLKADAILSKWEAKSIGQGLSAGTKEQYT